VGSGLVGFGMLGLKNGCRGFRSGGFGAQKVMADGGWPRFFACKIVVRG